MTRAEVTEGLLNASQSNAITLDPNSSKIIPAPARRLPPSPPTTSAPPMATTSSSTTTPSPLMGYRQTNGVVSSSKIINPPRDATETEERERAVQKFLASAELSKLTRGLRTRLGYASYKATHNLAASTLRDLEAQTPSQPISYPRPTFAPPGSNAGLARRGSMGPPPPVTASAGQSLFLSLLGPPPAKRARTIRNPQDPHVPAPVRPAGTPSSSRKGNGSRASINTSVAERTRSHAKGSKRDTRKKPRTTKKGKGKDPVNDVDDMKAAATLTSLLMHSRPSGAVSASSPRSSVSGRSEAGSAYSHLALSSTRSVDHPNQTPSPPMKPTGLTPKTKRPRPAATDSEAAELMMFLATSPSPARANAARDRDAEAYRALSGGAGLKGRVLFSGAPEESRMLHREATGSFASTVTAFSDSGAPSEAKKADDVMDVEMDVTPPTPVTSHPPQLLAPPISPPVSPHLPHSLRAAALHHGFPGGKPFEFLPTESRQNNAPHTPGNVAFNLNEFINVSPSPATPRSASAMVSSRMDVGRKLFADEHQMKGIIVPDSGRPGNPNRGSYLGAGIDFVRT